ncbi:ferritin [Catalinimonas alkaloidigena]|uniref:Ferritin n=1 Tax=Catalinimonas alkaloidigena TaxID=1075417 RepID=A0A1G9NDV8_9BACT|nr:ferritin [Catalinimonas alkaloidigena]SDL84593.1 ferritin [Catalinimonas alkaloidigena]
MKDLLRQRVFIPEASAALLNQQIALEAASSSAYLAMAAWCDQHGFDHTAGHFYKQSEEERKHMLKLFHYLSDMGGLAVSPPLSEVQHEFASLRDVFESALDHEVQVTESINKIVAACRKSNDFATENFMQWYVKEQVEEEYIVRRALELIDLAEAGSLDLIELDERLAQISYPATEE